MQKGNTKIFCNDYFRQQLIAMFEKGKTDQAIANYFEVHRASIRYWRIKLAYTNKKQKEEKKIESEIVEKELTIVKKLTNKIKPKRYADFLKIARDKAPTNHAKTYEYKAFLFSSTDTIIK